MMSSLILKYLFIIQITTLLFGVRIVANAESISDSLLVELDAAENDTVKVQIYTHLFVKFNKDEDFINSVKYAKECIGFCKNKDLDSPKDIAKAYSILGQNYYALDLIAKSLEAHTKSLIFYQNLQDSSQIAQEYLYIGSVYKMYSKIDLAYTNFQEALKYSTIIHDTILESSIYNNLGNLYSKSQKWDSAISYYHKSLQILLQQQKGNLFVPYMNISRSYANIDQLDSAKKYLIIASTFLTDDNTLYKSVHLYNLASIEVLEKDFTNAEKHLNKVLSLSKQSASLYDKASYMPELYLHTAISLENVGEREQAKGFFQIIGVGRYR